MKFLELPLNQLLLDVDDYRYDRTDPDFIRVQRALNQAARWRGIDVKEVQLNTRLRYYSTTTIAPTDPNKVDQLVGIDAFWEVFKRLYAGATRLKQTFIAIALQFPERTSEALTEMSYQQTSYALSEALKHGHNMMMLPSSDPIESVIETIVKHWKAQVIELVKPAYQVSKPSEEHLAKITHPHFEARALSWEEFLDDFWANDEIERVNRRLRSTKTDKNDMPGHIVRYDHGFGSAAKFVGYGFISGYLERMDWILNADLDWARKKRARLGGKIGMKRQVTRPLEELS